MVNQVASTSLLHQNTEEKVETVRILKNKVCTNQQILNDQEAASKW